MTLSVNTNEGAMVALQNLARTNKSLEQTQLSITTGLRVNGPKDDASSFAIAQNMRGEVAGLGAVQTALANGDATVSVAVEAGKAVSDLLIEMKAKVVQANQAGLDSTSRSALHNDFAELRNQVEEIVKAADFNGTNLVQASATATSVLSTVDGSTISVSAQSMDISTLSIASLTLTTSVGASSALSVVDSAITSVSDKLAALGSVAKRIEVQGEFNTKLTDIFKSGIGNLVDADLAAESAKLQALQIQQQLGVQALSIANSGPQIILGLFWSEPRGGAFRPLPRSRAGRPVRRRMHGPWRAASRRSGRSGWQGEEAMDKGVDFTSAVVARITPPSRSNAEEAGETRAETRPETAGVAATAGPEERPDDRRVGKIEQLRAAAEDVAQGDGVRLSISYDEGTGRFIYRGLDPSTGEVVRQYPPDELLERAARLRELRGVAIDREA